MKAQWERSVLEGTPALTISSDRLSHHADILFLGDLHWDHPKCDRRALQGLLDEALERDALIVLLGDTFCAMQVAGDRRGHKSAVRPEHQRDDYLTALVETAVEWFQPYKDNIWLVLHGNHETAVMKHHEVDLVRHFVRGLDPSSESIATPGYSSYALLRFRRHRQRETVPLWLAHGHGGGGPVTKGVIQAHRRAVTYPDARVVVSGHIHSSYFVAHEQHRVRQNGRVYQVAQEHYVVGTFKNEFGMGSSGWHVERGGGPTLPSGWWSRWQLSSGNHAGVRWSFEMARP